MEVFGLDIGYGFTKGYTGEKRLIFPTAVSRYVPVDGFSSVKPVFVNGEGFIAGEDAERESLGVIDTRTSGFTGSPEWLAALGYSLWQMGLAGKDIVLVLGIPPGRYNKGYASELANTVSSAVFRVDDRVFGLKNSRVKIIPQGSGIFFSYVMRNPDDFTKRIAVVDIGHHTIDFVFFASGKYSESETETIHLGISSIYSEIEKAFMRTHGIALSQQSIRQLLRDGYISICEERFYLPELQSILSYYSSQVSSVIDRFFEKPSLQAEIGIAGGGGVAQLKGLVKLKRKLVIPEDPEFSNAIGYWFYGKEWLR